MKKRTITIFGAFILMIFLTSSCKKWINTDMNNDPSRPLDTPVNLLLPSAEVGMAYQVGNDLSMAARCWMQQFAGAANQPLGFGRYSYTSSDDDNTWQFGMYSAPLMDLYDIMTKAKDPKALSPHYSGIAKVLMAYGMGLMTDLWGDVPYSDAFMGISGNTQPAYDSQQTMYNALDDLLSTAITDLEATTSVYEPGGDDLIYGGDLDMWKKAAWTLRARYTLHLAGINGTSKYTLALTYLANGFTANTDDLQVPFGSPTNEQNPLYQEINQRPGDLCMGKFLVDTMKNNNDPRLAFYVDTTGGAEGLGAGLAGTGSNPGPAFASDVSPVFFSTYVEVLFIKAECLFRTGDAAGAAAAYNSAVGASLDKFGISAPAWLAANASETGTSITLEKIMTQKYLGMYLNIEVFNDWRRTKFPAWISSHPALNNTTANVVPRRYPYPTSEKNYNSAHCPTSGVSLTDRVWWDVAP